MTLKEIN